MCPSDYFSRHDHDFISIYQSGLSVYSVTVVLEYQLGLKCKYTLNNVAVDHWGRRVI